MLIYMDKLDYTSLDKPKLLVNSMWNNLDRSSAMNIYPTHNTHIYTRTCSSEPTTCITIFYNNFFNKLLTASRQTLREIIANLVEDIYIFYVYIYKIFSWGQLGIMISEIL